jgi:hypothetical protein
LIHIIAAWKQRSEIVQFCNDATESEDINRRVVVG